MNNPSLSSTKPTIIIAAYNEATAIRKTLSLLISSDFSNTDQSTYQILVICNGCTDNTEKIIQDEFSQVHCYSLEQASKALAIRYAESLNLSFPRLYLDADIELSASDAVSLINCCEKQNSAALIVPSSNTVTDQSHPLVKSFYRAWYNTKHVQHSGYGAGAYLLNRLGRERFKQWPNLIADDGFIRSQFKANELLVMHDCKVNVKAPKNLFTLIKVKARSKYGNLELRGYLKRTGLKQTETAYISPQQTAHTKKGAHPLKWYDQTVYVAINVTALIVAKWQYRTGRKLWHRDNSNR